MSRRSKERREARRQRDKEWVDLQLSVLRLMGEPNLEYVKRCYYTRGLMQQYLRGRFKVSDLTSRKQLEDINQATQATS